MKKKTQNNLLNIRIRGFKGSRGQEKSKINFEFRKPRILEHSKLTLKTDNNIMGGILKRLVLFLFIILLFVDCGKPSTPKSRKNIEKRQTEQKILNIAPNFTLLDLDGSKHTLSDYKGNVVIIDFWATFCPPCRIEIPHFIEFYDEYKDRGLVILGVGLDGEEKLRSFRDAMRINYPILVGDRATSIIYGVQAIPVTFILNSEGEIIKRILGYAPGYEDTIKQRSL